MKLHFKNTSRIISRVPGDYTKGASVMDLHTLGASLIACLFRGAMTQTSTKLREATSNKGVLM